MTHAIRVHESGGPEVMRWEEVAVPDPAPGQVRLRQTAVGLNDDYASGARELFEVVERGQLKIEIGQRYALCDAAQAHRDLEGRRTTGSTVLTI